jgi:hypothetical protein
LVKSTKSISEASLSVCLATSPRSPMNFSFSALTDSNTEHIIEQSVESSSVDYHLGFPLKILIKSFVSILTAACPSLCSALSLLILASMPMPSHKSENAFRSGTWPYKAGLDCKRFCSLGFVW